MLDIKNDYLKKFQRMNIETSIQKCIFRLKLHLLLEL